MEPGIYKQVTPNGVSQKDPMINYNLHQEFVEFEVKAPSPLRSVGALHIVMA